MAKDDKKKMSKILTPEARLSYPNLIKPRSWDGGEEKYSAQLLFSKKTDISKLRKLAKATLLAGFDCELGEGGKWPKGYKNPIRNGDGSDFAGRKECKDTYVMNVNTKHQPGVVDLDGETPIKKASDIYPGCYVRAELYCYSFTVKGNKGVTFGLNHVQKLRNGPPIGGPGSVDGVFDAVESTEDDDYGNDSDDGADDDDSDGGF